MFGERHWTFAPFDQTVSGKELDDKKVRNGSTAVNQGRDKTAASEGTMGSEPSTDGAAERRDMNSNG